MIMGLSICIQQLAQAAPAEKALAQLYTPSWLFLVVKVMSE